jgi:hypothetical protein
MDFGASPFASDLQGDHGGYWKGVGLINMANIELDNSIKSFRDSVSKSTCSINICRDENAFIWIMYCGFDG